MAGFILKALTRQDLFHLGHRQVVKIMSMCSKGTNFLHNAKMREKKGFFLLFPNLIIACHPLPPRERLWSHFPHSFSGFDTHFLYSKITYCEQFQQEIRSSSTLRLLNVCFSKKRKHDWMSLKSRAA